MVQVLLTVANGIVSNEVKKKITWGKVYCEVEMHK